MQDFFLPVAVLSQWELNEKVAQLLASCGILGSGDPAAQGILGSAKCAGTWTASTTGVMAPSESFFEPLVTGNQKAS